MRKNTKYILQKSTPKIKKAIVQPVINQLFQKLKNKNTNKHDLVPNTGPSSVPTANKKIIFPPAFLE
jgi:hypothetical protein